MEYKETYATNQGYLITVSNIRLGKCDIEFECGYTRMGITYVNVKKGSVKYPWHPSVAGIGYKGVGSYKAKDGKVKRKDYLLWSAMINRCYGIGNMKTHPTYAGCSVAEEWHNFQNFAAWFEKNYNPETMDGWQLDKDILIKGNRIYSPEACCFVPKNINSLFIKSDLKRGVLPIGIYRHSKTLYKSQMSTGKKITAIGYFKTVEEAFAAYKTAKEQHIKEVAEKWKGLIDSRVYEAMYNYQVEITD